ncbi:hypothetical protein CHUUTOTORO_01840 [Serratia phage vB_SmaM-ChuuTotoro]|nr:hypothetical protein CHUUTOTORO_01840 [Serratia phage vB_SmaM-ChuuTotoro]
MKRIFNNLLLCLCDVTIGTGSGVFRFTEGQRVRADELQRHGIRINPAYFAEMK